MDPIAILFMPYALILPHRHWASHAPLVSTLIRVLYITSVAFEIATIIGAVPQLVDAVRYVVSLEACLYFFGMLTLADAGHYVCDRIGGRRK